MMQADPEIRDKLVTSHPRPLRWTAHPDLTTSTNVFSNRRWGENAIRQCGWVDNEATRRGMILAARD